MTATASILRLDRRVRADETDAAGFMRPAALFEDMQEAGAEGSARLGLGKDALLAKRLVWVLLRTEIRMGRTPRVGDLVTLQTWPNAQRHTFFTRHYLWMDERGEMGRASTLWTMMDVDTRVMDNPTRRGISVYGGVRVPGELPLPGAVPALTEAAHAETRAYTPSEADLDENGHVNNVRYIEWFQSCLPCDAFATGRPARLLVHYLAETRLGETLSLNIAHEGERWTFSADADGKRHVALYAEGDASSSI